MSCPPRGMEKGTSLNSTCLTPKPLASSVYVRVPEAPSPHERSISVMSLFPSLLFVSEGDEIGPIGPKLPVIPILSLGGQASNEDYQDHLPRRGRRRNFPCIPIAFKKRGNEVIFGMVPIESIGGTSRRLDALGVRAIGVRILVLSFFHKFYRNSRNKLLTR